MRTTVRLQDGLLRRAKKYAAEHDMTLTALLEEGLQFRIRPANTTLSARRKPFRIKTFKGSGVYPHIDITSNASLLDAADGL